MHTLRDRMINKCPACGAEPFRPCVTRSVVRGRRIERSLETGRFVSSEEIEAEALASESWLEFQVFVAVHNLKENSPNHYLVRAIEAALGVRPEPNPNQAELFPRESRDESR